MNQFLSEKQSEIFSTASNVETRDSRSRGGMGTMFEEQNNKEVSSVPLVNSPGVVENNEKQTISAENDLQTEQND